MILTVAERVFLLNIIDLIILDIVKPQRDEVSFTGMECKALQFKQEDGGKVKWTGDVKEKEIMIDERARDIIAYTLRKLKEDKQLKDEHMSLHDKFVT